MSIIDKVKVYIKEVVAAIAVDGGKVGHQNAHKRRDNRHT